MKVSIIVAMAKNRVIGQDEKIPWKIPGEQIRFKELTLGKTILMGRKTYESIGSQLPNRRTIVISRTLESNSNLEVAKSVKDAMDLCINEEEIFIAGGGQIYSEAIKLADKLYITVLDEDVDGNIFFPEVELSRYEKTYENHVDAIIPYTYFTYVKI